MAFRDEVETRFTTWAARNIQATKLNAAATQKDEAIDIGVAKVEEVFGTPGTDLSDADTDFLETDIQMITRGFLEAIKYAKIFIPFKIDANLQLMIEEWDKEKELLKKSRKQQENTPRVKERDHSRVTKLFPFGTLPWSDLNIDG